VTEEGWLAAADAAAMLEFVRDRMSARKLRLFTASCCRLFWDHLNLDEPQAAIETSERYADGQATDKELGKARNAAHNAAWFARYYSEREPGPGEDPIRRRVFSERLGRASEEVLRRLYFVAFMANTDQRLRADAMPILTSDPLLARIAPALLRDVFGNPFRVVTADPAWLTSTVLALANGVYEEWAFDRMPILADALQEAGCDNDEILNHCRSPGQHVRGCWAIDLLLGKT